MSTHDVASAPGSPVATTFLGKRSKAPRSTRLLGDGSGETAACTSVICEKNWPRSEVPASRSQVALSPTYPSPSTAMTTPTRGFLALPRQQQCRLPAGGEGVGGRFLFSSSAPVAAGQRAEAGMVETATVATSQSANMGQEDAYHLRGAGEDLLLVGPHHQSRGSSCRSRWIMFGRSVMPALGFAWSTARVTVTLAAALLAILITFWALSPICTTCVRSNRRGNSATTTGATMADESGWSTLYINQLQVIGTHNSYHRRTYVPALSEYWDYHYPSLTAQLDAGIRHLELDIHYDWKTGRWFVFHLSVLDPMSSCNCLSVCLEEIREWSDAHPTHHILFIEIELKLTGDFLRLCGQSTPDADYTAFREMQETVLAEFPRGRILTPKEVRGDYDTLSEAITETATPFSHWFNLTSASTGSASDGGGSESERGSISGSGDGNNGSATSGSDRIVPGDLLEQGPEGGTMMKGGWPLVDNTRGMVLFVIDYQSTNLLCRPAIRKALPEDDTVFFERTPLDEIDVSPLLAFGETREPDMIEYMARLGVIVRNRVTQDEDWDSRSASEREDGDEPRSTYIVDTAAQLVVWDDLRAVQPETGKHQDDDTDGMPTPLPCRSRCTAAVPEEECILEGFC